MMFLLSLRMMSWGNVFELLAALRKAGKYMASVLDIKLSIPTCFWSPNWVKWVWIIWAACSISSLLSQIKALSSTCSRLLTWNDWPWDAVLSLMSHPFHSWSVCILVYKFGGLVLVIPWLLAWWRGRGWGPYCPLLGLQLHMVWFFCLFPQLCWWGSCCKVSWWCWWGWGGVHIFLVCCIWPLVELNQWLSQDWQRGQQFQDHGVIKALDCFWLNAELLGSLCDQTGRWFRFDWVISEGVWEQ